MTKILLDQIVWIFFLGIIGIICIYLLIVWIFGFKCPKCKKRGMRKIAEVQIENNFDTISSKEFFVTYKCEKCGYTSYDNERRDNSTSN